MRIRKGCPLSIPTCVVLSVFSLGTLSASAQVLSAENSVTVDKSPKVADARPEAAEKPANSLRGAVDTAAVLGGFPKSPKVADARPEAAEEPANSLRGGVDTAAVLGGFPKSPKVADARPEAAEEPANSLRGAVDTA